MRIKNNQILFEEQISLFRGHALRCFALVSNKKMLKTETEASVQLTVGSNAVQKNTFKPYFFLLCSLIKFSIAAVMLGAFGCGA